MNKTAPSPMFPLLCGPRPEGAPQRTWAGMELTIQGKMVFVSGGLTILDLWFLKTLRPVHSAWDESRPTRTDTICPYCGVGSNLTLREQDGQIVRATSPLDHPVTRGNLCIHGRLGRQFV